MKPNFSKSFQGLTLRVLTISFFLLLFCRTFLIGQSKFIPTFARKDNTVIASRTIEVKEHGWLYFRPHSNVKPNELFTIYRDAMGLQMDEDIQTISIFDNLGRLVLSKPIFSQRTELNVADLCTGLYLVRVLGVHSNHIFSFIKKQ